MQGWNHLSLQRHLASSMTIRIFRLSLVACAMRTFKERLFVILGNSNTEVDFRFEYRTSSEHCDIY